MATTTPYFGWSVPTSTDYVKDGATAIETLGDSIDASMKSAFNFEDILLVQDFKTPGTNAGTFTSGAERTRDLNTVIKNTISGASLASNQITLPAGTFYLQASAPAYKVDFHKALWRNITDGTIIFQGTSELTGSGVDVTTRSYISDSFTIASSKVFELRHYSSATRASDGFGRATNFYTEVYSDVKIWKVG
jgi:hypothetical protein